MIWPFCTRTGKTSSGSVLSGVSGIPASQPSVRLSWLMPVSITATVISRVTGWQRIHSGE